MSEAKDQTHILMDTSWVHYHWAIMATPYIWFSTMTIPVRPYRVKGETNDINLDVYPKWGRRWSSPLSTFSLITKCSPLCTLGCASLPALLYLPQTFYANKLTLCLFLCLLLNSFCAKTREPEVQWVLRSGEQFQLKGSGPESPSKSGIMGLCSNLRCGWVQVPLEQCGFTIVCETHTFPL